MPSHAVRFSLILITCLTLAACTTVDFDARLQSCRATSYQVFPEKPVTVLRYRTETYEEFDGTVTCDEGLSAGGTTRIRCKQGRTLRSRQVPYSVVVDENADARTQHAWQCAKQNCIRDFGNPECERTVQNTPARGSRTTDYIAPQGRADSAMGEVEAKRLLMSYIPMWMNSPQIRNMQGFGSLCGSNGWKVLGAWSEITDVIHQRNQIKIRVGSLWKAGIPCSVWEADVPVTVSESDFARIKSAFKTLGADLN